MEQRKSLMRNQEGFTLIEIIAVLVLLGILAAVAVPKYFDMQTQAEEKALAAMASNLSSAASANYARFLLDKKVGGTGEAVAIADCAAIGSTLVNPPVGASFTVANRESKDEESTTTKFFQGYSVTAATTGEGSSPSSAAAIDCKVTRN